MRIAVLGLGEAGSRFAAGLAELGVRVIGFDPVAPKTPAGVERAPDAGAAVRDADIVASIAGAAAADAVLRSTLPGMPASAVYADFNTGGPDDKRRLAADAAAAGIAFADVAIMAPVPRNGVRTPVLVSGSGAARFAAAWSELGLPATDVGGDAGTAAGLKLLRSVFMKGLAALIFESTTAAEQVGAGDWVRDQIAGELGPDGAALVERLITGTRAHAERRVHEMEDVQRYLTTLGTPTAMSEATTNWLRRIADEGVDGIASEED